MSLFHSMLITNLLKTMFIGRGATTITQVCTVFEKQRKEKVEGKLRDHRSHRPLCQKRPLTLLSACHEGSLSLHFCFKNGSTLLEWGASRLPSPLLTITIQTPPLVLTSEEFKVLLDFLTFPTGPDIRLNKGQVSEIPRWQMLLFVRQLTVLEGKQAGPMKWTFCSYRLGPASSCLCLALTL